MNSCTAAIISECWRFERVFDSCVILLVGRAARPCYNSVTHPAIYSSAIVTQWREPGHGEPVFCDVGSMPMARKAKIVKPRRLYVPVVPANASWFESDSYDRRTWNEIVADAPSLADLAESGERLVPHFDALVQDLFFALFKMNPVFRKSADVRHAAVLNRTILEQIVPSAPFQALRSRTTLEEDKAAIAAIVMSEHALEMIKSEKLINRSEMLDLWDLARQEQDLEARAEAVKAVNEIQESKDNENESAPGEEKKDQATKKELGEMADAAERAAKVSEARLNQKSRQFETQLKGADRSALKRMQLKTAELAGEIDQA